MKIKICGITALEETSCLNRQQVDFAGMVLFCPKSKRNISLSRASVLLDAIDANIKKVAVVVAPSPEQIRQIETLPFDYIQIHGTLSEEVLREGKLPILRAFNGDELAQYDALRHNPRIAGYVFDAQEPGSGHTFDWTLLGKLPRDDKLLLLAGGLHAGNVADAIAAVHPDGVDVSSGVEYTDRTGKDPAKIEEFVQSVRRATSHPDS